MSLWKRARRAVVFWMTVLSIITGTMSAISAVVHVFDVGLFSTAEVIVDYYRAVTEPVYGYLIYIGLKLPRAALDILILYLVLLGICFRAEVNKRKFIGYRWISDDLVFLYVKCLLLLSAITLLPLRDYIQVLAVKRRLTSQGKGNDTLEHVELQLRPMKRSALSMKARVAASRREEEDWPVAVEKNVRVAEHLLIQFFSIPIAVLAFFLLNAFM
jgi:hypothetical protein